jgi:hypothetical protein
MVLDEILIFLIITEDLLSMKEVENSAGFKKPLKVV